MHSSREGTHEISRSRQWCCYTNCVHEVALRAAGTLSQGKVRPLVGYSDGLNHGTAVLFACTYEGLRT